MAGNHFLCAMLSAPCGHCCQRDDETLAIIVHLKQLLKYFLTEGKLGKKRRLQLAGARAFLCLAAPQLLGLAFVDAVTMQAAQSMRLDSCL